MKLLYKTFQFRRMNQKMKITDILKIFFVLVILVAIVVGAGAFAGQQKQKMQTQMLAQGYEHFNKGELEKAYTYFKNARATFASTLSLYRTLSSSETYVSKDELNELIVTVCLSIAHDHFFNLEENSEWVNKAEKEMEQLKNSANAKEISRTLATARGIAGLCSDFKAGKYQQVMTKLLEIEKNALTTDQDFFIFEIRMLIACGKAMRNPEILNQARELLFFITTDAGIENDKTRKLWGILTN